MRIRNIAGTALATFAVSVLISINTAAAEKIRHIKFTDQSGCIWQFGTKATTASVDFDYAVTGKPKVIILEIRDPEDNLIRRVTTDVIPKGNRASNRALIFDFDKVIYKRLSYRIIVRDIVTKSGPTQSYPDVTAIYDCFEI